MHRRTLTMLLSVASLVGSLLVPGALAPAHAAETTARPVDGVLQLRGAGWGHGRGMSQHGAHGAASTGLSWQQIIDFYYPSTKLTTAGSGDIRVWISGDSDGEMRVDVGDGQLTLGNAGTTTVLPRGRIYRVVKAGTQQELQWWDGASYVRHSVGANLELARTDGLLQLVLPGGARLELRGRLRAVNDGTTLRSVAVMPMDEYLRGVVPEEMPASWHPQALAAQAVAARSYAARLRADAGSRGWDTCDTVSCQVYRGTAREHPRTDEAVRATAGLALQYGSAFALTEFSSSNGGWTAKGSLPYQVAKPDPYDGAVASSVHRWKDSRSVGAVESAFREIGAFQRLVVNGRTGGGTWGGRITSATLVGSAGQVTVTGSQLRSRLGVRSDWFTTAPLDGFPRDWDGDLDADVLAVDRGTGDLRLYPGNGSGSFDAARRVGIGWAGMDLVLRAGDLDGDGHQDVLARRADNGELWLYSGNGRGGFLHASRVGTGWGGMVHLVSPGDWDGDGRPDLVAVHRDGLMYVYSTDGRARFTGSRVIGSGWQPVDLVAAVGDFDGDRRADLVARLVGGELRLYPGNGTGTFGTPSRIGYGWDNLDGVVGPGDWNGDGHADVLGRTRDGLLYLYTGSGRGTFTDGRRIGHGWDNVTLVP